MVVTEKGKKFNLDTLVTVHHDSARLFEISGRLYFDKTEAKA